MPWSARATAPELIREKGWLLLSSHTIGQGRHRLVTPLTILKNAESLIADDKCHKTLQMLSLRYTSLKSNQFYHFHSFHKAYIVRYFYTTEAPEKL
jgi:hypothetical protein